MINCNSLYSSELVSTGSYVPDNVVTNDMMKQYPEASRKLIEIKTGVRERRFADQKESTSDLAIEAAKRCLAKVNYNPRQLDAILLATSSPDRIQPATATKIQHELKAHKAFAFDINSVCSGFVYGAAIADSMLRSGFCDSILLVASEVYSKILNPADFSTYPYFGDGAAAVLLHKNDRGNTFIESILKTDGSGSDVIQIPAGGTMMPFLQKGKDSDIYFQMRGKEVYEFAVTKGSEIIEEILLKYAVHKDKIKYVIPHQANVNIIAELAVRTRIDVSKYIVNLDRYGNTAGASIPIGIDELFQRGAVQKGDLLLTVAFGGGLSWGANLIMV